MLSLHTTITNNKKSKFALPIGLVSQDVMLKCLLECQHKPAYGIGVPRKIRQLIRDLKKAGFEQVSGAGKSSHRKFVQDRFPGAVTISAKDGADAKRYQEQEVKIAIERTK